MLSKKCLVLILLLSLTRCSAQESINLAGVWNYRLDKKSNGIDEKWFTQRFESTLNLPGSLQDNKIGNKPDLQTPWTGSIYDSSWYFNPSMEKYRKPGNFKFPFWLTPDYQYLGVAWYQKEIDIPKSWQGKTLYLVLERPHWQTQVWLDTIFLGNQNSLSTPHIFSIENKNLKPVKHLLTVRVDNAIRDIDPGINSHSISDHTQGNWNGIVGDISLFAKNSISISNVKITPVLAAKTAKISILFNNRIKWNKVKVFLKIEGINHKQVIPEVSYSLDSESDNFETEIRMGDNFKTWSEFSPNLYQISITLKDKSGILDVRKEVFGMREFSVNDKHFEINGIPVFLRGTTECSVFPLTGYPSTVEKDWLRIFEICKSFGLNHMRFHSYCPPEAAFLAADKAGIYLQVEGPSWAKYSVTLGDGKLIDKYLMDETKRIIDTYGNHPSFCMMAYGNEPSGHYVPYLENWVDHFKKYDPQRVFTGASTGRSWSIIENSDFIVRSPPRGLEWKDKQPETEFDYNDKTENQNRPYISFEMGQWCAFPNFKEIPKYSGPLKAKNFELFQEDLNDKHMGNQADEFLMASGKLQSFCYKQEIEATLRTPNLAGFQLLSLNDFPGQGTAIVGVLDAFWEEKGYISAKEFKAFCNKVVPLVRLPKYTFENSETLEATIEVANFSGAELKKTTTTWQLTSKDSSVIGSGSLEVTNIPLGNCYELGKIKIDLSPVKMAEKLTLKVKTGEYTNSWNIWVYPKKENPIDLSGLYICKKLDDTAYKILKQGGKVLLLAAGSVENGKDVVQYFTPVFWNTSWFKMRPPHTTGMLVQAKHPVFNDFPTDYYSDFHWWEIINKQQVMNIENFPPDFRPIVQPIDTWFLNRRLALLFEANVEGGSLMVCSSDISDDKNKGIAARQLYNSIINYMKSEKFKPENQVKYSVIQELFEVKKRKTWDSYVNEKP
jgi:hypothetical protein